VPALFFCRKILKLLVTSDFIAQQLVKCSPLRVLAEKGKVSINCRLIAPDSRSCLCLCRAENLYFGSCFRNEGHQPVERDIIFGQQFFGNTVKRIAEIIDPHGCEMQLKPLIIFQQPVLTAKLLRQR